MAEPEKQPEQQKAAPVKHVIATKVSGTVKWFNVKSGYGFINRNDTKEDVFVHQSAIVKNNPKKAVRSVGDGEIVEFDVVVGEKGNEAANVTGPEGEAVKGSPYAADKRRGYRQWFYPRRRNVRPRKREGEDGSEFETGDVKSDEGGEGGQANAQRRFRPRRRFGQNYFRRGGSSVEGQREETGEGEAEVTNGETPRGGGRGRGGSGRRYFRRNYRGVGPGRSQRTRNQNSEGQTSGDGDATDQIGTQVRRGGGGRPRFRRARGGNKTRTPGGEKKETSGQTVENTTTTESVA